MSFQTLDCLLRPALRAPSEALHRFPQICAPRRVYATACHFVSMHSLLHFLNPQVCIEAVSYTHLCGHRS